MLRSGSYVYHIVRMKEEPAARRRRLADPAEGDRIEAAWREERHWRRERDIAWGQASDAGREDTLLELVDRSSCDRLFMLKHKHFPQEQVEALRHFGNRWKRSEWMQKQVGYSPGLSGETKAPLGAAPLPPSSPNPPSAHSAYSAVPLPAHQPRHLRQPFHTEALCLVRADGMCLKPPTSCPPRSYAFTSDTPPSALVGPIGNEAAFYPLPTANVKQPTTNRQGVNSCESVNERRRDFAFPASRAISLPDRTPPVKFPS
jgi:hypothetical protein